MATFGDAKHDDPFHGLEFSVRQRGTELDASRVAITLNIDRLHRDDVANTMAWIDPSLPLGPARFVDSLVSLHSDLDVVIGATRREWDWLGKVYLLAGSRSPEQAWPQLHGFLKSCGMSPNWQDRVVDAWGLPTMVAADLVGGHPLTAKMYFRVEGDAPGGLGVNARLPDATEWVVSVRGDGNDTVDVTLHARIDFDVEPWLPKELAEVLQRWQAVTNIVPTHLSWMGSATTLYYQVRP
jgi:hypothetical protein